MVKSGPLVWMGVPSCTTFGRPGSGRFRKQVALGWWWVATNKGEKAIRAESLHEPIVGVRTCGCSKQFDYGT